MKKTQWLVLLRDIRSTVVSFISIIMFVSLGAGIFMGIRWSGSSIAEAADVYYAEHDFRDYRVSMAYGLSEDDLSAIEELSSVSAAEGGYSVTGTTEVDGTHYIIGLISMTEKLDTVTVLEGAEPAAENEIGIEQLFAEESGLKIGDTVCMSATLNGSAPLKNTEFIITAIVEQPAYIDVETDLTRGRTNIGDGVVDFVAVLSKNAFDTDVYDQCFSQVYIRCDSLRQYGSFDADYEKASADLAEEIEALGRERAPQRTAEVMAKYDTLIADGEQQLTDGEQQLIDGRQQLADGEKELADGRIELESGEAQIADARAVMAENEQKLADARIKIANGEQEIADAEEKLDAAKEEYKQGQARYEEGKAELRSGLRTLRSVLRSAGFSTDPETAKTQVSNALVVLNKAYSIAKDADTVIASPITQIVFNTTRDRYKTELENLRASFQPWVLMFPRELQPYDTKLGEFIDALDSLDLAEARAKLAQILSEMNRMLKDLNDLSDGISQYIAGSEKLANAALELNSAAEQIAEAQAKLDAGKAELTKSKAAFAKSEDAFSDAEAQMAESADKLSQGWAELLENESKLADARVTLDEKTAELEAAKTELEQAKLDRANMTAYDEWLLGYRSDNASFTLIQSAINSTGSLCYSVAVLFVFVGAMICYTAISRLIRESQTLIGVQKALGFTRGEITFRYMAYSISAALLGLIVGTLLAYYAIEPSVNAVIREAVMLPECKTYFSVGDFAIMGALELGVLGLAAWIACRKLLSRQAVELLRGDNYAGGRVHFYEKTRWWKHRSLYAQTTVNNLANDSPRVVATLIGIVGCTALVVAAMGLLVALKGTPIKHFTDIAYYDENLYFDTSVEGAREGMEAVLDGEKNADYLSVSQEYCLIKTGDGGYKAARIIVPEDTARIGDFFSLRGVRGRNALELDDSGVLLSYTYSKYFGTAVGDTISLVDMDGNSFECAVSGITQHYLSDYQIIMTPAYYKSVTGDSAVSNSFLINLNGADSTKLMEKVRGVDGFFSMKNDQDMWVRVFGVLIKSIEIIAYISLVMAFAMAMLVLLNLNVMFINEKARELIIMRVNGFDLSDAKKYVYRDNIVLTIAGILLGITVGIAFGILVLLNVQREGAHYYIMPSIIACAVGAVSSAVFSLIANLIALRRVGKFKLSDLSKL